MYINKARIPQLDNKYWILQEPRKPPPPQYHGVLDPPECVQDVAYWMNMELEKNTTRPASSSACINAAVEASTLMDRDTGLLPADEFVRDSIQAQDTLVVSVGANDIALKASTATMASMAALISSPDCMIEKGVAPGLSHFVHMFGRATRDYIMRLTDKQMPRQVLVCMVYYLDHDSRVASWANHTLSLLGYNKNPDKLEFIIRKVFELGTKSIEIPGTSVIPVPLFEVLDGKNTADYEARVEPSVAGGSKLATFLVSYMDDKSSSN
ncbi:hypothetical protein HDU86_005076 [Geranomyces michiganensis]|nr:hypothetical protein HDU86_005076 [Geranomyces michiganensis]